MYYVMRYDTEDPQAASVNQRPEIPGFERVKFTRGVRIEGDIPVFDCIIDADGQGVLTDYLWTVLPQTISLQFREVLENAGVDNVDYYSVRIVNELSGEIREDYFQANIIGNIACLDEQNTEMAYEPVPAFPGRGRLIGEISNMVLDESKLSGELLFRLNEVKSIIIVHEKIKQAAEDAQLTGVIFPSANGFSWP